MDYLPRLPPKMGMLNTFEKGVSRFVNYDVSDDFPLYRSTLTGIKGSV